MYDEDATGSDWKPSADDSVDVHELHKIPAQQPQSQGVRDDPPGVYDTQTKGELGRCLSRVSRLLGHLTGT